MKIGIDIESGESPFQELIKGSLKVIRSFPDIHIFLIGDTVKVKKNFTNIENYSNISLIHADEIIHMHETPIFALKRKKNATVNVGIKMLKNNEIDVFFSPGNTGATVAVSVLNLGMIKGIRKPAMAAFFPRTDGEETLILDIGANPEANDINLYQNAILGLAYYNVVKSKTNTTVGLLNIGEEFNKGSASIKKAFSHLQQNPLFIGNVEGHDVFDGNVDIVLCDGFTGNSILKIAEAMKKFFITTLKDVFSSKRSNTLLKTVLSYILSALGIYTERKKMITKKIMPQYYGAAPLLGVNGIVLIGHGTCGGKELINAIELAYKLYKLNFIEKEKAYIKKMLKKD